VRGYARSGDVFRSFTLTIAATLALTPIVWLHYLVLLLVPVAIARPRFSHLWLLPSLLWFSPRPMYPQGYERFMPALVAAAIVYFLVARRPREITVRGRDPQDDRGVLVAADVPVVRLGVSTGSGGST